MQSDRRDETMHIWKEDERASEEEEWDVFLFGPVDGRVHNKHINYTHFISARKPCSRHLHIYCESSSGSSSRLLAKCLVSAKVWNEKNCILSRAKRKTFFFVCMRRSRELTSQSKTQTASWGRFRICDFFLLFIFIDFVSATSFRLLPPVCERTLFYHQFQLIAAARHESNSKLRATTLLSTKKRKSFSFSHPEDIACVWTKSA